MSVSAKAIIWFFAILFLQATAAPDHGRLLTESEPLRLEFCKGIGYETTSKVNFLKESQHDATKSNAFKALVKLYQTGCSRLVKHFACSVFAPKHLDPYGAVPPCKSICTAVSESCADIFKLLPRKNSTVPVQLYCELFENEACIDAVYSKTHDDYKFKLKGEPKRGQSHRWMNEFTPEKINEMFD